jgi:hypothetical protein
MWYQGTDGVSIYEIGYAASLDGIVWERRPDPMLSSGNLGNWDGKFITRHVVILQDKSYKMWYGGGSGGPISRTAIGYATGALGDMEYPQEAVSSKNAAPIASGYTLLLSENCSHLRDGDPLPVWSGGAFAQSHEYRSPPMGGKVTTNIPSAYAGEYTATRKMLIVK